MTWRRPPGKGTNAKYELRQTEGSRCLWLMLHIDEDENWVHDEDEVEEDVEED